jgi:hypothetical protein
VAKRRRKTKAESLNPPDEAVAFTFLGGMFVTLATAAVTKSLLALVGGTVLTVGAIHLMVGDSEDEDE